MVDVALPAVSKRTYRLRPGEIAEQLAAWSLAGPGIALIWLLLLGPALVVFALSFSDWQFGAPDIAWAGLANYRELLGDEVFWKSLWNTLIYVAFTVPLSVAVGLGVALLIEAGTSLKGFYRAAFFLPVTSTLIAMAFVFQFAFHPTSGAINLTLGLVGIKGTDWLANPQTALYALGIIGIWQAVGLNMVLFIAGLKAIPKELYEAAAVDGIDNPIDRFMRITWPMLGPATVFVVSITAIRSFQVFDTVAVLTDGGPNKSTSVLLYQMYQEGFSFLRSAYAAAITCVFLAFVLLLTLIQVKVLERRAHYG
ncbi:L-arabinose transport system permease protein AraP [Variibacter gotjawalensis]|uniref:L-arabinose transport system permease protein AraP n=1 Tax=Variibacter gotjawalensis TaxID=1333996 RepID=A0A0S3PT34_9BRAD|nr:sugar ABC transporter permease [Variibacter gotjawalensis]NIK49418.1 multiple sugar transport system permease protein [Variibacter gotjawalensis]RZS51270.1 carbohydrate ABC transporter membrane protein 1 (CUT1 family) [Variibacter gotjawalensis]BAT59103.1 L-arabinose transport system permease protein AraP [Variibacter gotjawalensis]